MRKKQISPEIEKPTAHQGSSMDTFMNQLARIGNIGSTNFNSAADYPIQRLSKNYNLMNSLYRNSWIAKKIINTIPDDMTKNWFKVNAELDPKQMDRYVKLEKKTKVRKKVREAMYWGRLYGGAGAVMMIAGDEDKLDEPLVPQDILPDSFKGFLVLDRWSGIYPSNELIEDIEDPDFGEPAYYEIKNVVTEQTMQRVHHSRVLRFIGRKLPNWEELSEIGWGASELEHVFDELTKRDNTSWSIASLVFQANLLVNTVDGIDQLNSMGDPDMQRDLYNLKTAQNQMRSNQSMMVIGEKDKVEAIQYTFSGLNEISETQMMDISGACDIPITRLFGRSPAGMSATGESDAQNYCDMINQQQHTVLKPELDKLLPVMFMSEFGMIPDDLDLTFNPIQTPTEDKLADTVIKKVTAIQGVFESGLITQKIGMQELAYMSDSLGIFTSITDEDIAKADDSFGMQSVDESNFNKLSFASSVSDSKEFVEGEHKRDGEGKFSSGGSESNCITSKKDDTINQQIDTALQENGISSSIGKSVKPFKVSINGCHKHAAKRMAQRGITQDHAQNYINDAVVCFEQTENEKYSFYSEEGSSTCLKDGLLITAFPESYFDDDAKKMLKAVKKIHGR
jgi:phage-related protein (TIGR01555 family)